MARVEQKIVGEHKVKKAKKARIHGWRKAAAAVAAGAEAIALPVGVGYYVHAEASIPTVQAKVYDLKEANINVGATTEELTSRTTNDKIIGGVSYRGESSEVNPYDAAGTLGYAERKASEAKEKLIANALLKVRQQIIADAEKRGYRFNESKNDLAGIAEQQIVPKIKEHEEKVGELQDQRKNGILIAAALPATLFGAYAISRVGKLAVRGLRSWRNREKDPSFEPKREIVNKLIELPSQNEEPGENKREVVSHEDRDSSVLGSFEEHLAGKSRH